MDHLETAQGPAGSFGGRKYSETPAASLVLMGSCVLNRREKEIPLNQIVKQRREGILCVVIKEVREDLAREEVTVARDFFFTLNRCSLERAS